MIPTAIPWEFFHSNIIICFRTKYDANLKVMSCQVLFIDLSIHQDPKNNWRVLFKIEIFARFSLGRRPSNKVV